MIRITDKKKRELVPFWNHCLFHPTDAIEDPWGRRIIDRISEDGAIKSIRIYAMLEDIVYLDGEDRLAYDFRLTDLRLDYLISKGFDLLIAYAGMPDCIAKRVDGKTSVSKNKTRYKGKLFNTSPPKSKELWEEVCFKFTEHIVERYGEELISRWRFQCFNEPDIPAFFMSELPDFADGERLKEYIEMYEGFVKGIRRATSKGVLGGPVLAFHKEFFEEFLREVRERKLELGYIALHNYGTNPDGLNSGSKPLSVSNNLIKHEEFLEIIKRQKMLHVPVVIDEWGGASHGFFNIEECPGFIFRENEIYSSYFTKLISQIVKREYKLDMLMICLSGQHEMTTDFSGFRNFFTLNFIAKPIYNAHILSGKLKKYLTEYECDNENIDLLPTVADDGSLAVMLTYSNENFTEELEEKEENVSLPSCVKGKSLKVYCIDKRNTNPYRLYERMGIDVPCEKEILALREEGRLKPVIENKCIDSENISLHLTPNSTFLLLVE